MTVIVLTRYLKRPGHFFGGLGIVSGGIGFCILASLAIEKIILFHAIGHRPLLQLGILLVILGVQLVSTGLIGELIHLNSKAQSQKTPRITHTL
jgi:dolichol-phosphate mannosyltransferase